MAMNDMLNLKNVTLICIDGIGKFQEGLQAIRSSIEKIKFAKSILLTSANLSTQDDRVEVINIPKMNWNEYNEFVISQFGNYFDTDFALLCQDDGYISNPNMWTDDFLKYDYIGAPWQLELKNQLMFNLENGVDLNNNKFIKDIPKLKNYNPHNYRVGNGGFSLRSKKLSEFTKKYSNKYPEKPEDNIISIYEKEDIENNGMKIAPIEIAAKFSVESPTEFNPRRDKNQTFGFHRF
jgi:hypothetical protein